MKPEEFYFTKLVSLEIVIEGLTKARKELQSLVAVETASGDRQYAEENYTPELDNITTMLRWAMNEADAVGAMVPSDPNEV